MPTNRMVALEQLAVACTIGILPQPFSVHDVKAKLGFDPGRVGLTMAFFEYCGLATKAPGRGMYSATRTAIQVAEAWAKDAELGKAALRKGLNQTWFTKSARNRLAPGPGLRDGLHARFMMLVGGGDTHRRSVDKLMELMILSGLLIEEPDGFVRWHEHAAPRPPEEPSSSPPADGEAHREDRADSSQSNSSSHPGGENNARAEEPPTEEGPGSEDRQNPSTEESPHDTGDQEDEQKVPVYDDDPTELLADPLWLRYVRHMTPDEATRLHQQLHGVLSILAETRARARADTGAPSVELDHPYHLADLGRVSLATWLNVYASSRGMSTFIPSMRSRQSTPQA
ncbi:hypothetical protein RB628_00935 [Streptomyces sp. ADMS]|uniref:hypothetical protein n=1 Tax=Streptomyces sp. ADMS TaxID=3071415 RepID=UPI00296F01F9|nr:hypothetical protein [Streptomyces sp. ADMS]MDW4903943.1 hypothetical protein [Streptomyces sp. ADMS]